MCKKMAYPPAEHTPNAIRSSIVFGKIVVSTDADTPATPNPLNVLITCKNSQDPVSTPQRTCSKQSLNWTPTFEWYMARFVVRNGHPKDNMCYNEIGLCAHNMDTILGLLSTTQLGGPM